MKRSVPGKTRPYDRTRPAGTLAKRTVPRQTAPSVVAFLNREIVQCLKATDRQRLAQAGVEVVAGSPEEFASFIKSEMDRMGKVFKGASFSS